jgi:hypothetical protein
MKPISRGVSPDSFQIRGRTFSGLGGLPRGEAERLHRVVVRYGTACGCHAGAIGLLLTASLALTSLPLVPAIVVTILGGVTGKCLGLWWARRRFDVVSRELDTALSAAPRR